MRIQHEIKLGLRDENGLCRQNFCKALLHRLRDRGVISADAVRKAILQGSKVDVLYKIHHRYPVEFKEEFKRVKVKLRLLGEDI
jgi:hypothetical protein